MHTQTCVKSVSMSLINNRRGRKSGQWPTVGKRPPREMQGVGVEQKGLPVFDGFVDWGPGQGLCPRVRTAGWDLPHRFWCQHAKSLFPAGPTGARVNLGVPSACRGPSHRCLWAPETRDRQGGGCHNPRNPVLGVGLSLSDRTLGCVQKQSLYIV